MLAGDSLCPPPAELLRLRVLVLQPMPIELPRFERAVLWEEEVIRRLCWNNAAVRGGLVTSVALSSQSEFERGASRSYTLPARNPVLHASFV